MIVAPTPTERLAQSRERLRHALNGTSAAPGEPTPGQPAFRGAAPWWEMLTALPGAGIVIEAAQQWWARHPMRVNTLLAFNAAQAVVHPLAQRHPLALVAGAFLVGGLLAWRVPLGWILKPALFAGLVPQLLMSSLAAQSQRTTSPTPTD